MADEDDFTFCQVGPSVVGVEAQKAADKINRIQIEDVNAKAEIHKDDRNAKGSDQNGGSIWEASGSSQKQRTIGSLSFNVVDASSNKEIDQRPEKARQEISSPQPKLPVRKAVQRKKVPFEIGFSPMDWLKLTTTHPDLAGLKGQSNKRLISLNEVKQHKSEGDMWTVLKGRVYNISPYMKFHPGGVDMLMKAVGKDCTSLFNKYHAWVNAEFLMEKCLVGILDENH
ncbi:hypothetical protein CASFOL_033948 [Castilleja foliolosa]|uniref:Cytochrome b5 heme-binding domain-containing protein n=1 Tax=Castilleja foliolosa TaxID=1961234 RepID=A0ABD3BZ31_9LAMI